MYVVDSGNGVIDKFSETGAYVGQITGATCETATELPPCEKSKLVPFSKGEAVSGIAVDPQGSLWADEFPGNVYEFGDGLETNMSALLRSSGLLALGVDAEDNLYLQEGAFEVRKYSKSGELLVNAFWATQRQSWLRGTCYRWHRRGPYGQERVYRLWQEIEAFT